jgi:RNA polymerase sigma-70 factor (ECF subfamily)
MIVYLENAGSSILQCKTLDIQAEILFREVAGWLMDSFSATEKKSEKSGDAAVDIEDVRQSRRGDSEAYRRLIERHQEHVARIMWRFSRDRREHEELVEDVFVEAYMSLNTYRRKAPFEHWLARIATRVGYRYWKRTARRHLGKGLSLEQWEQVADKTIAGKIPAREAAAILHGLLARLPARDRLVLTLRYIDECSIAQTAARTGWSQAMVKVQTWRAMKKLKSMVERK